MTRFPLALTLALALGAAAPAAADASADASALRDASRQRVGNFLQTHTDARAQWRVDLVGPSMLLNLSAPAEGASPAERAAHWVAEHAGLFGLTADQLQVASQSHYRGRTSVTFQQVFEGAPVHQRNLVVVVDNKRGLILRVVNGTFPVLQVRKSQRAEGARQVALARFTEQARAAKDDEVRRVVIATPAGAYEAALVTVVPDPTRLEVVEVIVDLNRGEVAGLRSVVQH